LTLDLEPEPDDGSGADLGVPPDRDLGPGTDLGRPNPCEGAENGGSCALGDGSGVCIDGRCVPGECGDGFVTGDELCDDGNTIDGDGCQANCQPSCEDDAECPSTECTVGTCETGRCEATPTPDGTNCTAGICRTGMCVSPSCGDGIVNGTEVCDDGNDTDDDGCDNDCHPSCFESSDCADGIYCNGEERCVDGPGDGARCMPAEDLPVATRACEYCDDATGRFELRDEDGDGYTSVDAAGCGPTDCDDTDPTIYPGAPETTPGVDSNCDGELATDASRVCYLDEDDDGFGDPTNATSGTVMSCPLGFVPAGAPDCNDEDPEVNPGQLDHFTEPYCTGGSCSFDYDCDGREERKYTTRASCSGLARAECEMGRVGWNGRRIPDCGEAGNFGECRWTVLGCITSLLPTTVVQSCR